LQIEDNREALEALAEYCGRFSPTVGVGLPDSLLLDVTGLAHLFGGEAALAEQIVRDFARRGRAVRVAIADTIGAAWAVAHEQRGQWAACGLAGDCKMQNANCKLQIEEPRLIVPPGETAAALRPLPIEALRLPAEVVDVLHQLGIRQIGQLEALPREELSVRFGPRLLLRMDQATGRLAEPIPVHNPQPRFQAAWSLEHPTARRETVEAILEHLIARVAAMLLECDRGAMRLECRLGGEGNTQVSVGLFEPSAAAGHLFQLVRIQFECLRIAAPVAAVSVEAAVTAPLQRRQQELFFADTQRRDPRHLAVLLERLSSRLGRRAVLGVRLMSDAAPERAWRYDPLIGACRPRRRRPKPPAELPPRPLRLLPRPAPLDAMSVVPDGPPLRFHLYGREHQVARTWGPERIETGWWRGRVVGRDYYRLETTTGRRFWLFRRLRDGQWFLHGAFE